MATSILIAFHGPYPRDEAPAPCMACGGPQEGDSVYISHPTDLAALVICVSCAHGKTVAHDATEEGIESILSLIREKRLD